MKKDHLQLILRAILNPCSAIKRNQLRMTWPPVVSRQGLATPSLSLHHPYTEIVKLLQNKSWLRFVGDYRTFLLTSGMPTSDEFANLWTLSPYCANSVY